MWVSGTENGDRWHPQQQHLLRASASQAARSSPSPQNLTREPVITTHLAERGREAAAARTTLGRGEARHTLPPPARTAAALATRCEHRTQQGTAPTCVTQQAPRLC